ncbi:glycosyltransferase [Rhodothermus marinus]|uniref:glycosyltransferase n=1 Tax=Rhodothermus marinus TaxID=29549 RepID=UPI00396D5114
MKLLVISHACVTPINQDFWGFIMHKYGWNIDLVVPETWRGEYGLVVAQRWKSFAGRIWKLPVLFSGSVPLHIYRARLDKVIEKVDPDVVYVHHEPYGLATFQWYLANKIAKSVPIGFFSWQNILKNYPLPVRVGEQWVYRNSSFAFVGSKGAEEVLREKGYKGPVYYKPGFVNLNIYKPYPEEARKIRRELGVEDKYVIGFVGRLVKEKGIVTLVKALSLLGDRLDWVCFFIGKGNLLDFLKSKSVRLGIDRRVMFMDYIKHENIPYYLSLMDLLILPSETQKNWKEQFGRVIIEAMACGTPVIGSSCGEIPHLIQKTGGGLIFREGDYEELAECIVKLLHDEALRKNLAIRGSNVVRNEYSLEAVASAFVCNLERVLSRF